MTKSKSNNLNICIKNLTLQQLIYYLCKTKNNIILIYLKICHHYHKVIYTILLHLLLPITITSFHLNYIQEKIQINNNYYMILLILIIISSLVIKVVVDSFKLNNKNKMNRNYISHNNKSNNSSSSSNDNNNLH